MKSKIFPPNQNGFNDIMDLCQDYGLSGHGPWCPNDEPPKGTTSAS